VLWTAARRTEQDGGLDMRYSYIKSTNVKGELQN